MDNISNAMMNCSITDSLNLQTTGTVGNNTNHAVYLGDGASCWGAWTGWYYPQVIRESYPVYLQERAKDSGKQAYEIIKALQDKKLMKLEKVSDFIEAMDTLIKVL